MRGPDGRCGSRGRSLAQLVASACGTAALTWIRGRHRIPSTRTASMLFEQSTDFDIGALYSALDAQRQARGMSWPQVVREINALFARVPARPISPSTLNGMRNRGTIEGDGVLQML